MLKNRHLIVSIAIFIVLIAATMIQSMANKQEQDISQLSLFGSASSTLEQVERFDLEIEGTNGDRVDMKFHSQAKDKDDSLFRKRINNEETRLIGEQAEVEINNLVKKLPHPAQTKPLAFVEKLLEALGIPEVEVGEVEL